MFKLSLPQARDALAEASEQLLQGPGKRQRIPAWRGTDLEAACLQGTQGCLVEFTETAGVNNFYIDHCTFVIEQVVELDQTLLFIIQCTFIITWGLATRCGKCLVGFHGKS